MHGRNIYTLSWYETNLGTQIVQSLLTILALKRDRTQKKQILISGLK